MTGKISRSAFLSVAVLASSGAAAQQARPASTAGFSGQAAKSADVVITGRSLADTKAALDTCLNSRCAPRDDIQASLAHGENLFVAGDYATARNTLQNAVGRDRRFAASLPVEVAGLLRATARVEAHLGEAEDYRRVTLDEVAALKAGLPAGDARVLAARIEVGDMFADLGRIEAAGEMYRAVARDAGRRQLPAIGGAARVRDALLEFRYASPEIVPDRSIGYAKLDAIAADPAVAPDYRLAARVLRARYDNGPGAAAALQAAVRQLNGRDAGDTPILLHFEPIHLAGRPSAVTQNDEPPVRDKLTRLPVGFFDRQWIDVAFWIQPDGAVADPMVLRASNATTRTWDAPVLASIRTRQYTPLKASADGAGMLRVERYTYTSDFDRSASGTRLPTRDGQPRLEVLDLSAEPSTAALNVDASAGRG